MSLVRRDVARKLLAAAAAPILAQQCLSFPRRASAAGLWTKYIPVAILAGKSSGRRSMQSTLAADEEPAIRMLHHEGLSEIKGRGWFATRDLKPGELVFRETPIRSRSIEDLAKTVLESPHLLGGLHVPEFYQAMRPPEGVDEEEWSRAVAMAASNGFRTPHGEVVLLEKTSLFNHSCRPNAAAGGTGGSDIQVRAIKEIKEGQEVCICYDSAVYLCPTERRRAFLKERWGFDCECPRCVAYPQDADQTEKLLNSKRHWGDVGGHARLEELFHNLEGRIKVAMDKVKKMTPGNELEAHEAKEALLDAIDSARKAIRRAEGMIHVTHWRMQAGLRGLSKCLMLLMVNHPEAYAEHCDATASWAELGSVLRIGMRAEQAVCPKLHPMRLETFGMWCSIPYEYQGLVRGHADAVGTVPEDLEPLRAFWEGQSDHPPA